MKKRQEEAGSRMWDDSMANRSKEWWSKTTQWGLDSSEMDITVGVCGRVMPLRLLLEEIIECQSTELVEVAYDEMIDLLDRMPNRRRPDVQWMDILVKKLEPYVDHLNEHGPVHLALVAILAANEEAQSARSQSEK
jgi:hypothetical protein